MPSSTPPEKDSYDLEAGAPVRKSITPGGHTVDRSEPAFPTYHRKFGNPGPLGLFAFSLTTFLLSIINVGARGVTVPGIVVAPALIYGGFVQLLAGMWEMACGQTFGATVFTSFGGFWICYALIISPWSDIGAAYVGEEAMFGHAIGFFLAGWLIFTILIFIAALRSSIALALTIFWLILALIFLTAAEFVPGSAAALAKTGGAFGLLVAFNGWYVAIATLLTPDTSYFTLPLGSLAKRD